jgi:glycosyltransferase involved in cell wall biosynthesis
VNIIIVSSSYPLHPDDSAAAAGLFVRDLALEIAHQGHAVRVLTQDRAGAREDDPELRVERYPWAGDQPLSTLRPTHPRDALAMLSVIRAGARALAASVAAERPDLLLALWAVPAGWIARHAGRRARLPYRVWALGSDIWGYGRNPLSRPLVRRILRDAERVFADGLELADEVQRLGRRNCAFLPSARKLAVGQPRPEELADDRVNLVFIGRFHANKGVDLLVDAIAMLDTSQRARLRCHLFGGGPLEPQLREQIRSHGLADAVHLMGYADRAQAAAFLEHCDALVVPSRIESIPLVLSDAAQARCPILATRVGDMPRILDRYGAGICVAPDASAIRQGLLQLLQVSRADYGDALASMAADFSVQQSGRRLLASD